MSLGKVFQRIAIWIPATIYLLFSARMAYIFFIKENVEAIWVLGIFSLPSSLIEKILQNGSVIDQSIVSGFWLIFGFGLMQYFLVGVLLQWVTKALLKSKN